jgi:hypothetical protein
MEDDDSYPLLANFSYIHFLYLSYSDMLFTDYYFC